MILLQLSVVNLQHKMQLVFSEVNDVTKVFTSFGCRQPMAFYKSVKFRINSFCCSNVGHAFDTIFRATGDYVDCVPVDIS